MEIDSTTLITSPEKASGTAPRNELDRNDFYRLMIAELTNQDPFEPLDNRQFLEQIASLQSLDSTTRMTDAIDKMAVRQDLSSASGLVGKFVVAQDEDGKSFGGFVSRIRLKGDEVKLVLEGGREVELDRVTQVATDPVAFDPEANEEESEENTNA